MPTGDEPRYLPIADYALLSDCRSSALVSRHGSIDWACFRRFDEASTFGRLLDHDHGGHWTFCPVDDARAERRYEPGTMVLETTFTTATGSVRLLDALAMHEHGANDTGGSLVRLVECTDGEVEVATVVEPRFDYAETTPWLRHHARGVCSAVAGDDAVAFHSTEELQVDLDAARLSATTTLRAGDQWGIVAHFEPSHLLDAMDSPGASTELLDETRQWWLAWSASTVAEGPHAAVIERSALVLKSLCCAPTGAIVAAPTTSLPEVPGGSANWDYRCCWIRDAAQTLDALSAVGHHEVAEGFRAFVMRSAAGHGDELQILYGPYGERRLPELELPLEGWRGSTPVRIGNAAATQRQLDVYGHLLDAVHLWHVQHHDIDADEWRFLTSVVERAIEEWELPDHGIWEVRGDPRHYVHSKVMVWLAIDCAIGLVQQHSLACADIERWCATRDAVRHAILTRGVDPDRGSFVDSFGSNEVDASLLKLALVGFVPADDPRMVATVQRIIDELSVGETGLIRRFRSQAGEQRATDDEGVFLLCSLWLVQVLALQGRDDEASQLFDRVLATGNDLGLYAEEHDPVHGELLGNFPQAYTHLGIINAARRLRGQGDERPAPHSDAA